ncbi:hypothetical protein KR018_007710, partial [Drosophila ironensis]
ATPSGVNIPEAGKSSSDGQPSCSWPSSSPPSEWGTSAKGSESAGPRELKPGENPLRDSRIFHVLWRNQTTKKHKTWTGNGTLVVTGAKLTLKDETGKAIDSMQCFKMRQIKEQDQLQIGSKDVEVQDEIRTLEECALQRKMEIASWCQKIDTKNGYVEDSENLEINLPLRSHILKKRPRLESPTKAENPAVSLRLPQSPAKAQNPTPSPARLKSISNEYICVLSPAELQVKTLSFLAEISRNTEMEPSVVVGAALEVCDHPVLLKARETQPDSLELMELLGTQLPPWPEMGIYDSAKFEFVHLMLDHLVVEQSEKCCIVANNLDCLRLVKGYCQSWDLAHVQVEDLEQVASFNSVDEGAPMVALVLTNQLAEIQNLRCNYLIVYNHNARMAAKQLLAPGNTKIYTLITGGDSPEEREFYRSHNLPIGGDLFEDIR